jgi:hypothetical protein
MSRLKMPVIPTALLIALACRISMKQPKQVVSKNKRGTLVTVSTSTGAHVATMPRQTALRAGLVDAHRPAKHTQSREIGTEAAISEPPRFPPKKVKTHPAVGKKSADAKNDSDFAYFGRLTPEQIVGFQRACSLDTPDRGIDS